MVERLPWARHLTVEYLPHGLACAIACVKWQPRRNEMRWWMRKRRSWSERQAREEDLDREVRSHLDLEAKERQESGLAYDEAHYAAQLAFGNMTLIKEDTRAMWGSTLLDQLGQDLKYAIRT